MYKIIHTTKDGKSTQIDSASDRINALMLVIQYSIGAHNSEKVHAESEDDVIVSPNN